MKLVVLGSGTSVPHAKRASSCYWLETAAGFRILLDASGDATHRMAEEQLDWPNLDAIWISHFHWDHFAGLLILLFALKWSPQTQARSKSLRIIGGEGLQTTLEKINDANSFQLTDQRFPIEIIEPTPGEKFHLLSGLAADVLSTPHKKESRALRIVDEDNKSLVYTGDTGFSEELIPFCSKSDLLLMECSFKENKPVATHLELRDAMKIASVSNPARVLLTHLYPEWDQFDLVTEAKRLWSGETIEATDGLRLII